VEEQLLGMRCSGSNIGGRNENISAGQCAFAALAEWTGARGGGGDFFCM